MKKIILNTFVMIALCGCSASTLQIDSPAKRMDTPQQTRTVRHYFWGAFGDDFTNLENICPAHGVNSIIAEDITSNGLLNFFTGGIYMPATYSLYCNKK